jgi:hypothetical protein
VETGVNLLEMAAGQVLEVLEKFVQVQAVGCLAEKALAESEKLK